MLQNLQGRELRDAMYIQDQYQEGSGSSMASSAKGDDEREGGTDDDDLKNGLSTQDGAEGKAEFKEPKKRKEDKEEEVEMPAQKPVSVEEANKGAVEASAIDVFASESDLSDQQIKPFNDSDEDGAENVMDPAYPVQNKPEKVVQKPAEFLQSVEEDAAPAGQTNE